MAKAKPDVVKEFPGRCEHTTSFALDGETVRCDMAAAEHVAVIEHHHGAWGCWHEQIAVWPRPSGPTAVPASAVPACTTPGESVLDLARRVLGVVVAAGERLAQHEVVPPRDVLLAMADAGAGLVRLAELEAERHSSVPVSAPNPTLETR